VKEPNPINPFSSFWDPGVREARSQETWSLDLRYHEILKAFGGIAPLLGISTFWGLESRGGNGLGHCISKYWLPKS
jgi:hypothetical protein